ncbi:MAG: hypothetical protein ACTSR7_14650 [Promethearchaeota archaeon]
MVGQEYRETKRITKFKNRSELNKLINEKSREINQDFELITGINGQGVTILMDGIKLAIDHWDSKADVLFISHAHMDHVPLIPRDRLKKVVSSLSVDRFPKVICSRITRELIEYRTKGNFTFSDESWLTKDCRNYPFSLDYKGITFTILENGHVFGSNSLFIEGSKTIFYTSEFMSKKRFLPSGILMNELKPRPCDYLVIDATFGEPFYKFPPFDELYTLTKQTIDQYCHDGFSLILLGYSYGKSQLLLKMLDGEHPIYLSRDVANIVNILENNGITFPNYEIYRKEFKKKLESCPNFIFIASPNKMFKNPLLNFINKGAKSIIFSGRILLDTFKKKYPVDNYIPLSDHSDFESTVTFIEKCAPSKIFLESGRIELLSYILMKKYGSYQIIKVLI